MVTINIDLNLKDTNLAEQKKINRSQFSMLKLSRVRRYRIDTMTTYSRSNTMALLKVAYYDDYRINTNDNLLKEQHYGTTFDYDNYVTNIVVTIIQALMQRRLLLTSEE